MCIEAENMLIRSCLHYFTLEDLILSCDITKNTKQLLQSGCQSSAAAAALLCITKEDELVCELSRSQSDVSEALTFANVVRRSASKFLLFEGSEQDADAAAGVMLGMAKEAEIIMGLLKGDCGAFVAYLTADNIRQCTVEALTKLEKELVCRTACTDGNDTPIGTASAMNCKGNSVRKSEVGMTVLAEKTNKKMRNKSLNIPLEDREDAGTKRGLTGKEQEGSNRLLSKENGSELGLANCK